MKNTNFWNNLTPETSWRKKNTKLKNWMEWRVKSIEARPEMKGYFQRDEKIPRCRYAIFFPRFPLLIIRFPFAPTFVAGTKRGEVCVALNSFTSVSIQCVSKEVAMTLTYRVFLNYAVISYKNDKISHALRALIKSFKNSKTYYSNTKGEKIHLPKTQNK
jgi:hypothetical protein